jgi:hypothetical protein
LALGTAERRLGALALGTAERRLDNHLQRSSRILRKSNESTPKFGNLDKPEATVITEQATFSSSLLDNPSIILSNEV